MCWELEDEEKFRRLLFDLDEEEPDTDEHEGAKKDE